MVRFLKGFDVATFVERYVEGLVVIRGMIAVATFGG